MSISEEESFVILGSSPMPSICADGNSLLRDALEKEKETKEASVEQAENILITSNQLSASTIGAKVSETTSIHTNGSAEPSLAASFLLGEVPADVLKNSVYSQFPSLCSMEACAEDVVKLQNMMTEYVALKQTLDKVHHTMQDYYKITQQWRQDAASREQQYKEQLELCQAQIDKLKKENQTLKNDISANLNQLQVVEEIQQKENDDLRQSISEKNSLIQNMRVEIDKLAQQQLQSYEVVPPEGEPQIRPTVDFIKREEHDRITKDLQREMSRLLAENLEVKEMQKIYLDEINCLKVNLTSYEEILNKTNEELRNLNLKDAQKQDEITHLQTQVEIYRRDFEMERADREKNAGEKEQYLQDLRALQRRNQELIEALSKAKDSNSDVISTVNRSSLRDDQRPIRVLDPTGAAAKTSESVSRCPICSKSFNSLSTLQTHVNDCLDKS
ncbi:NF-kappa-B essential modulator [Scaptodrosophila lebanonensis]|uniref:NF-kappa-B essential modulator n=1 Tax=Drosophila lebanonensis TaxID=7225 RepID=A0A6J2UJQ6_DROLE|nr:NF-kappa-B essential modulator [Scaptodrosophila lebanonensis]